MTIKVGEFVVPGEIIPELKSTQGITVIGPGLRRNEERSNSLCVTQPGTLCFKAPNIYWIEGKRDRYVPKQGDLVVGIVTKKAGDTLKIDVGGAEFASLSMLAFEGATKKQKPDVQVGDLVYAKMLKAHREMEPELVCIDSYSKAGRLGVLSNDGFLIKLNKKVIDKLLNMENPLLRTIGKKFPYEIIVGVNGNVWLEAKSTKNIFTLIKSFEAIQNQDDRSINEVCNKYR